MLTTDQTLQTLTDSLNGAGIDTPQKLAAFITNAGLQVQKNIEQFKLTKLQKDQQQQQIAAQTALAAQQAAIAAVDTSIQAALATQAGS